MKLDLPKKKRLTHIVKIRLTESDYNKLLDAAKIHSNENVSMLVRFLIKRFLDLE